MVPKNECNSNNMSVRKEPSVAARQALPLPIIDRMPLGYIVWDRTFLVLEWNRTAEKIFVWSAAEAIGRQVHELVSPAGAQQPVADMLTKFHQGDESNTAVCENVGKDGRTRTCEWYNTPLRDGSGEITGVVSMVSDVTERRQVEKELRESKKLLQTIIDTEPECVKLLGADGSLIMMNRAGLNMIQVDTLEQVKGQLIGPLVLPEYRDAFTRLTVEVFQGKPGILTFEMTGVQGRRLWLETHAVPLRNERDEVVALLGITRDVTEWIKAKDSMLEQMRFAENLAANSTVATFAVNPQHRVILWNKACEELTGVPAAGVVGTDLHGEVFHHEKRPTLADIIIDGDRDRAAAWYANVSRSALVKNGLHAEGWYPNLHGRDRYLVFDAAPVHSGRGELTVVIETVHDLTERKRAEEALQQEKRFSDGIIDSLPGIFLICDEAGRLIRWNDNEKQVTGYSVDELSKMNVLDLFRENRELIQDMLREVFGSGYATCEAKISTRSGFTVPVLLTGFRMILNDTRFFVGVGIDLSERKRLEDQLRQAQKMESIGTLAGGISHDFNNILTAIIGYANLLQMKISEDDPLRHNVDQVLASANRAATLTQGLLAYSRKQILNPKPVDLNEAIRKVERLLVRLIGEDIELKTMLTDRDATVLADIGQLEQVLMNLATNARDAMPEGGRLFLETDILELDGPSAKAHDLAKPGPYALITVTDSGMGMDAQTRERIFEPFFTTKDVGRGTGLGLAMVYGIIKQHKGSVEVESEEGRGTTFKIYLPVVRMDITAEVHAELPEIKGGTETILIAEDDEMVRGLTCSMLEQFGYTVIQAVNGEDAVNRFMANKDTIRLLLLDIIMPKKNGGEVYEKIRIFQPGIKALFLSGYTADIIHEKGLLDKDLNFILKPVPMNELLRKIRTILDTK